LSAKFLPALLCFIPAIVLADPIDTAHSFLDAIEFADGHALEELLSEDLLQVLHGYLEQARLLAGEDPALAAELLRSRYGELLQLEDLLHLTNQELFGIVLQNVRIQPDDLIEAETAEMEGRNARVVLTYLNGATVSFSMTWENSDWRISDTSLLRSMFR
jgi:hypothetical protein